MDKIVPVIEIHPGDELSQFVRDYLLKRWVEDAAQMETDNRIAALERRINSLEAELEKQRETEWGRYKIAESMIIDPINVSHIDGEDVKEDAIRAEYYRRVAAFEAAESKKRVDVLWHK